MLTSRCLWLVLLQSWNQVLGSRLEGPFGEELTSALWSAKNTCCACFAICSFHCCISERLCMCLVRRNWCLCGAFHGTARQMYQLTHAVASSLSVGKSSTNRLRFSSNLLLGFKLFTALSSGLQLLCISNTPNQLFVKFEIQDISTGHAALKE